MLYCYIQTVTIIYTHTIITHVLTFDFNDYFLFIWFRCSQSFIITVAGIKLSPANLKERKFIVLSPYIRLKARRICTGFIIIWGSVLSFIFHNYIILLNRKHKHQQYLYRWLKLKWQFYVLRVKFRILWFMNVEIILVNLFSWLCLRKKL